VDIAMFAIYGLYDREQLDKLIAWYFPEGCSPETVWKIYGYVACCGLLWSNWCEYKRSLGTDFGAYSLAQYRYAKDYGRLVKAWLEEGGKPHV
jgi:thiamine kinase-like enzyme